MRKSILIFFWIFNGLAVTVEANVVTELAARPEVAKVQLDIQNLKAAGIAVVFAAGNSGPGYFSNKKVLPKWRQLFYTLDTFQWHKLSVKYKKILSYTPYFVPWLSDLQ
jgi:hypothetical protein